MGAYEDGQQAALEKLGWYKGQGWTTLASIFNRAATPLGSVGGRLRPLAFKAQLGALRQSGKFLQKATKVRQKAGLGPLDKSRAGDRFYARKPNRTSWGW